MCSNSSLKYGLGYSTRPSSCQSSLLHREKMVDRAASNLKSTNVIKDTLNQKELGSVLDIIPLADSVMKLSAQCELCGKHTFFTVRKSDETQTELIGGADVHMLVCRQHYVNGQVVIKLQEVFNACLVILV
ncbi:hypothetical protein CRYUN_Cryun12cG0068400 [Craigia yunnanensis]